MFRRTHRKFLYYVRYKTSFLVGITLSYNILNKVSRQMCLFFQNYLYFQKG